MISIHFYRALVAIFHGFTKLLLTSFYFFTIKATKTFIREQYDNIKSQSHVPLIHNERALTVAINTTNEIIKSKIALYGIKNGVFILPAACREK